MQEPDWDTPRFEPPKHEETHHETHTAPKASSQSGSDICSFSLYVGYLNQNVNTNPKKVQVQLRLQQISLLTKGELHQEHRLAYFAPVWG